MVAPVPHAGRLSIIANAKGTIDVVFNDIPQKTLRNGRCT
jgi:hypothetical protein